MSKIDENEIEEAQITELVIEETAVVTGGVGGSNSGGYPLDDSQSSSVPTT